MKSLRMGWFAIVVLAIGCGSSSARESGKVTEIPGYVHTIERSRFILGDVVTQLDSSGMHKIVGTLGTFSSILASGAADAIPNHSIPDSSTRYHPNDAGQQDTEVHSYLESAGMPGDQMAVAPAEPVVGVQIPVDLDGGLEFDNAITHSAWFSNLNRKFDGIEILGSFAWAILDDTGASVEESVYWPSIGADVVAQLQEFQSILAEPQRSAAFMSALPTSATDGRLVIRHTNWAWSGTFVAVPCLQANVASATFCFGVQGNPILLPDEANAGG